MGNFPVGNYMHRNNSAQNSNSERWQCKFNKRSFVITKQHSNFYIILTFTLFLYFEDIGAKHYSIHSNESTYSKKPLMLKLQSYYENDKMLVPLIMFLFFNHFPAKQVTIMHLFFFFFTLNIVFLQIKLLCCGYLQLTRSQCSTIWTKKKKKTTS